MAKKRIGDKAERVLKLLLGLRNKKIASALASRGFGTEDLEEGFTLLRGVTTVSLAVLPPPQVDPSLLPSIDDWENEWFPVADATLARHYPDVHAKVFLNLSQDQGAGVIVSVGTLVERIEALTDPEADHGQAGVDARALLERRGLTPDVIDQARALLAKIESIDEAPAELVDLEQERARLAEAEDAMWAWYLEWSAIARAAIKNRQLLRRLGFLSSTSRASRADDDDDDAEDAVEPAALAV